MDFTGQIALWQQRIAEITKGAKRRVTTVDALEIVPGQTILDIGCGGGELTRRIALAVGSRGRAIGFDRSADQLSAARDLCADLPWVDLVEGDAIDLPFQTSSIDGFITVNTLEYIPEVDRALAEARRVLKPGGKAAIHSVVSEASRFYGSDADLERRVLAAWRASCPHQILPVELPAKMGRLGYDGIKREPFALLEETFDENTYGFWVAKICLRHRPWNEQP